MRPRFWLIALIVASLGLSAGLAGFPLRAQEPEPPGRLVAPQIAPIADVAAADRMLRASVSASLQAAADRAGVAIDTTTFVYGSSDDVIVANAAVAGLDTLTSADLRRGADLMFAYLSLPTAELQRDPAQALPPGFYTVNLTTVPGSTIARAQLRNEAGRVVAELPALVDGDGAPPGATARPIKVKVSVRIKKGEIEIDIEITWRDASGRVIGSLAAEVPFRLRDD